ncbi:MAG: MEDS domain-containing protein, partial [Candidatus Saccharibacteria bacterium]
MHIMSESSTDQLQPKQAEHAFEDHIALIYESAEERLAAVTPLIKVGLEKGELCLYISNEDDDQALVEALATQGVDVEKAIASGSLIITSKREVYFKLARFDPDWTLRVLQNIADIAKSYGFSAMRVMSDMTWTLERMPGINLWPVYEARLNNLHPGISMRIICQYDRKTFPPEVLMAALKTHPKVVSGGQVSKSSYYMPTEQLLAEDYNQRELDQMLDIVRRSNQLEAELQDRTQASEVRGQRIEELEADLSRWKARHSETETALNELTANFKSLSLELSYSRESLSGMEETINRKDEELVSRTQQMRRMETEMAKLKADLDSETLALNESVSLCERTKADLAARSEEAEQAWAARDHIYREKEQLIKIVQERDEGIVELHAEVERLYGIVKERREELEAAKSQLANLEIEVSKQRALAEQYRLDLLVQEAVHQGLKDSMWDIAAVIERSGLAAKLVEELQAVKRELSYEQMARDSLAYELNVAREALALRESELAAERQALTESNDGYQAIFEQAGAGIVRTDLNGRLLEANDRFHTMLGYQPRELVGTSYREITHRDDLGRTTAMYERLLAGE